MAHWIIKTGRCKLCGKVSYASRDDAEYAAGRMLEPKPMLAYECYYGNGWHLTTVRKVLLHGRQPVSKTGAR